MTLAAPGWLLMLLALPVLWWFHRRLAAPRDVVVASLLLVPATGEGAPATRSARSRDTALALLLGAIAVLAIAAAGPRLAQAERAVILVVVDGSVSMGALDRSGSARPGDGRTAPGPTAFERALAHASATLRESPQTADARLLVRRLCDPAVAGEELDVDALAAWRTELAGEDGLPATLVPHLEAARATGAAGVLLITDRAGGSAPGVVVLSPPTRESARPREGNVALEDAWVDGDQLVVSVRNHGTEAVQLAVRSLASEPVSDSDAERGPQRGPQRAACELEPQGIATVRFDAPPQGVAADVALTQPTGHAPWSDALPADDRLVVTVDRGSRAVRLDGIPADSVIARLLRVLEFELSDRHGGAALAVVRGGAISDGPGLQFVPAEGGAGVSLTPVPDPALSGAAVSGGDATQSALPAPATRLVATSRLVGGESLLESPDGSLAVRVGRRVVVALDPDDPASGWHRDGSYPALVGAWMDELLGPPVELSIGGRVSPSESAGAAGAPGREGAGAGGGPAALRALLSSSGERGAGQNSAPGGALALLAAGLIGVVLVMARRGQAAKERGVFAPRGASGGGTMG